MNNNKNILITGGLGFIGAHCIEKWKKEGGL
jgi:nucleoside-diphosphate-sugar epimerase